MNESWSNEPFEGRKGRYVERDTNDYAARKTKTMAIPLTLWHGKKACPNDGDGHCANRYCICRPQQQEITVQCACKQTEPFEV